MQKFDELDVGYFCFWARGSSSAPTNCTDSSPYVATLAASTSIDGKVADVCGLRESTCPALNDFNVTHCSSDGIFDDRVCGFAPPNDAKCVDGVTQAPVCTMRYSTSDDCPDTDCNTELEEPVCGF